MSFHLDLQRLDIGRLLAVCSVLLCNGHVTTVVITIKVTCKLAITGKQPTGRVMIDLCALSYMLGVVAAASSSTAVTTADPW